MGDGTNYFTGKPSFFDVCCSICGCTDTPMYSARVDDSTATLCEGCTVCGGFRVITRPLPLAVELDRLWTIQHPDGHLLTAHVNGNVRRLTLGAALYYGLPWTALVIAGFRVCSYPLATADPYADGN